MSYLAQPEKLLTVLSVLKYQCSTTDLFDSTGNASHYTDSINTPTLYHRTS
jgi:hypothetical protein